MPPTNGVFRGTATLTASGVRLYFEAPGNVSTGGPSKTVSFPNAAARPAVRLSISPDRDSLDEDYLLTIVFTGANSVRQTNAVAMNLTATNLFRFTETNTPQHRARFYRAVVTP